MSPEHREVAEMMLDKARDDLRSAETLIASEGYAEIVVGFLLQQAVEKSLKAMLAAREMEIRLTHDLEELIQLVQGSEPALPTALASAAWLTPWAVDFRYGSPEVALDTAAALEAATAATSLAAKILAQADEDAGS